MLNFDLANSKPKLQNNSAITLGYKQHLLTFFTLLLLGLCTSVKAQEVPKKDTPTIPAEINQEENIDGETIVVPVPSIIEEVDERAQDTTKTDTIKPPNQEVLKDIVEYYGEDYVYIDKKTNKVYMYNKAYVIYEDVRIDAGLIILDYNKNEIYAKGIDSAGNYSQRPVFTQGANKVEPDSIKYNYDSEKALVYNSRGEESGFRYIAETTKKVNDSVIFLRNVKFTTSKNIEDPEYYFYTRRAKFVPKKKIVTGLTNMYIADVPTPIGLPFAYFPLTEDRTSGFIIPTIGENNNRGFFFQNGGYYLALSEYFDLTLQGDYYTNGSYALRAQSAYALKYKFTGGVNIRYENLINSERGFPDFSQSTLYNIQWNHSQDQKSSPLSRFSASVNFGSSEYFQQSINQINNGSALVNTLQSSVSYSKTFEGDPQVNTTVSLNLNQNTQTQEINLTLPNITANVGRIFPFAPKTGTKKGIIDNINLQYDVTAQNRIRTTDSLFGTSSMFDDALIGVQHRIPISTNFKVLEYLSATASTTYTETWSLTTFNQRYDIDANEGSGGVVRDTISGFDSYRTYNFNTSLGTTIYGTFNISETGKIQKIRHVMRPSISYNINPGFEQYYDQYEIPPLTADPDVNAEIVQYSRFENTIYGAPGRTYSSNIGMSLSNNFEAKVRSKDSTATEPKKVVLLNNLTFSSGYNLSGDSLKWNPVSVRGAVPIIPKLDINFSATLDPYALDNNNQRIDTYNTENGGSLFRLTQGNVSLNYSFSSEDFKVKKDDEDKRLDDATFRNGGRQDDLFGQGNDNFDGSLYEDDDDEETVTNKDWFKYTIPWDLRLAYTITYNNIARQDEISSQSLMFSSNLELSPRWKVGVSSGYDFKNKGVTTTQFRFQRDLESWKMSFNWTPIGAVNTSWYFYVGIKSSVLSDIKYDKRREPDQRL
ncbi:organic solvent tolerance protein OstA [Patiriisocius marinistellae]|uniref:Organic solvent tolerance protein OstA n=1 Tax=Patiriisocius marinistellae TaxID=2494560 RepID=A0A5J4G2N8_9FLAO|nr:putative LPS assembly protein LptD [Patiriisocius marinistellae]GEQ86471.1 organic solvent tolerance protein OstA [Patiriisocius marinistellae]